MPSGSTSPTTHRATRPRAPRIGAPRVTTVGTVAIMSRCADAVMAIVFAPACAACRGPLDTPSRGAVCQVCWAAIRPLTEPLCQTCGDSLPSWRLDGAFTRQCLRCRRLPRVLTRARAIGSYEGALRDILHALKYGGRRSVAPARALDGRNGRQCSRGPTSSSLCRCMSFAGISADSTRRGSSHVTSGRRCSTRCDGRARPRCRPTCRRQSAT